MNSTIKNNKFNQILSCSQDKSLSKSTATQDSFYQPSPYLNAINSQSQSQMKTLFPNKSIWKMPINLYAISNINRNYKDTVLKLQSSLIQRDISQSKNDSSIQFKPKAPERVENKSKSKALLFQKEKEMLNLSNSMHYSFQKAIHDPMIKLKNHKRRTISISKAVINDYQRTNNSNKKLHSKRKYNQILDLYYEQKKEFQRKKVIEREIMFNEAKANAFDVIKGDNKCDDDIDNQKNADQSNWNYKYEKTKQLYEDFNKRKYEVKAKQWADSICNINCKPFSEINAQKARKTFDKYNKQNLERAIKIVRIENSKLDNEDMEYYLSNNRILKRLLEQNQLLVQNEEQKQLKSNIIKNSFKQTTLNRIKMHNGYYFGVPM